MARKAIDKRLTVRDLPVELQAQSASRIQHRLDHAGFFAERGRERAGVPGVADTLHSPDEMPETLTDLGSGLTRTATDLSQRQLVGVVMDAKLWASLAFGDMRLRDAGFGPQQRDQPSNAAVLHIGRMRQEDGNVEAEGLGHDRAPQETSRVGIERSGTNIPARWATAPATKAAIAKAALRRMTSRLRFISTSR